MGYSPQSRKELDTTEHLHFHFLSLSLSRALQMEKGGQLLEVEG